MLLRTPLLLRDSTPSPNKGSPFDVFYDIYLGRPTLKSFQKAPSTPINTEIERKRTPKNAFSIGQHFPKSAQKRVKIVSTINLVKLKKKIDETFEIFFGKSARRENPRSALGMRINSEIIGLSSMYACTRNSILDSFMTRIIYLLANYSISLSFHIELGPNIIGHNNSSQI